jgi:hypothetical protein
MASSPSNTALYAEIRSKKPLDYKTRKTLLTHWTPKIAKAICRTVYPDFRGTYEQHLWLLTHNATETEPTSSLYRPGGGYTTYAEEARQKGILFLWPYPRIEDTRICSPSHYLHYIVRCERSKIDAILAGATRCSARLNAKHLTEALRLYEVYAALPTAPSRRFDEDEDKPRPPSAAAIKLRLKKRQALKAAINAQMMLTADNQIEFKAIAYGWTHLRKQAPAAKSTSPAATSTSPAAQEIAAIDTQIQARRY